MIKRLLPILAAFALILCGIPHLSNAAPTLSSVTGTVDAYNTVTINGLDLGAHSDYSSSNANTLARAWNNFEGGTILRDDWAYGLDGAYSENWSIGSGATNRTGSTYFANRNYVNSRLGGLQVTQSGDQNEWYWSFYVQISSTCPTSGGQGKISRIYGDNGNIYFAPYNTTNKIYVYFESIGSPVWGTTDSLGFNTWHRVEIAMKQSPQSTRVWIDGVLQFTRTDWPDANFNGGGHTWDIGNMVEQVQNTCYHRFDDVFFDHTLARVELCNNSTRATSTICEPQVPTSWSSTAAEITVNTGALPSSSTAYFIAFDATGAESNALEVTIGSGITTVTCYPDVDNDLYPGTGSEVVETCSTNYYEAGHFAALTTDCDDTNAAINPGASDSTCDGIDQDCSGLDMNGECTVDTSFVSGTASMTSGTASIIQ